MDRKVIETEIEELGIASIETLGSDVVKPELIGFDRLASGISAD